MINDESNAPAEEIKPGTAPEVQAGQPAQEEVPLTGWAADLVAERERLASVRKNTKLIDPRNTEATKAAEEDQGDPLHASLEDKNKGTDVGGILNCDRDTYQNIIKQIDASARPGDIAALLANPESPLAKLLLASENFTNNHNAQLLTSAIKALVAAGNNLQVMAETVGRSTTSSGKMYHGKVADQDQLAAVTARLRGMRKIYLHASGFHVVIRSPTVIEINGFLNSVAAEADQVGSTLGGQFYYCLDGYLKKKFMEFFLTLVTNSNLPGWMKGNTLSEAISFHDYESLALAVSIVMYPKGVSISHICVNQDCKYVKKGVKYDLAKLQLLNLTTIDEDAMSFTVNEKPLAAAKGETINTFLQNFRNISLGGERCVNIPGFKIITRVPSIQEYLDHTNLILSRLIGVTNGDRVLSNPRVTLALAAMHINAFTPWIQELTIYGNANAGSKDVMVSNPAAITQALEYIYESEVREEFVRKMEEVITSTKVSFVGFLNVPCESCHKRDEEAGEFRSFDANQLLFTLSNIK